MNVNVIHFAGNSVLAITAAVQYISSTHSAPMHTVESVRKHRRIKILAFDGNPVCK
jgi:hypothetical protein